MSARDDFPYLNAREDDERPGTAKQCTRALDLLDSQAAEITRLTQALRDIAEDRCENFTKGDCFTYGDRTVKAKYGADRVCQTCIAHRALAGAFSDLKGSSNG